MRDYDDEHTMVDGRRGAAAPKPPPVKLPAFIPCETVVPVVTYRDQNAKLGAALASLEASVMERMPQATPVPAPLPTKALRGALTVVFGCRGGSGSTTLAINTAAQLVRLGRSVCIVDLDLHLGDLFVALDLEAQTSLASVAREAASLDATSLRRRVAQHASGICALTQAGHVDDLDATLPARLPALLDALRGHFDHVIVDGVRDFGDVAIAALEAATAVLVVVTQDVPSVRRASRALGILRRLGVDESRSRLVVNRAVRGAAIDDLAIERALSIKVSARVREDDRVAKALDDGVLLLDIARTRKITADIAAVAALVGGR
jgi:pilus assembly protein CpaE